MPYEKLGAYDMWMKLRAEFPEMSAEVGDYKMMFGCENAGTALYMKGKEVRVPEDMNGLKIFASGTTIPAVFAKACASTVSLELPDWNTSLERGLTVGMVLPCDAIYDTGVYKLLPYHTAFP